MTEPFVFKLWVPGHAEPQGSKTRGRWSIYDDNPKTQPWRQRIALAAADAMTGPPLPPKAPVYVELEFVLRRPVSAPKSRTPEAVTKPDIDKLVRAVLDALTGIVFPDDAAVTRLVATKRRAELQETPGVRIEVIA